jgi:membrane-bound metal-dependent hydrolase YbcI (DUF457 family)
MIAGHFGLAAAVKSRATDVPLWALMLATVWLDIVFVPLFLTGIETLEPVPGTQGGYGNLIIHADYTHSLTGALVLSALFGLIFLKRWGRRCALVLSAVSFSHWLLDLIVHRGDLAILPGNASHWPRLGFGLWQVRPAAIAAELVLVAGGAWLYRRAAIARTTLIGSGRRRAEIAALMILICGIAVLLFDVAGA